MAKKTFKDNLGSLIREAQKNRNTKNTPNKELEELQTKIKSLEAQLRLQAQELKKWRTGKLSTENFKSSLAENNLTYKVRTNTIEPL